MIAAAWNNGLHLDSGGGYGIKVSPADREEYFKRE